ncbi:MFS transporter [Kribbella deserti]|uniref:MFS transporter n=1 Tax=Kribbella deserti TaxID=1926257 RepID=A0ABV6QFE7_9ACTN
MTSADAPPLAGRKEWTGLAVLALPTLLLSIDLSVLNLALPQLSADLGASTVEQLWIIDIYGFMIAGFLITMGTLGDRIGRRKLLLIGGTLFAIASIVAAFSPSTETLIASRALMGIAGATLSPSTLALISNMFRDPRQLGTAIGVWVSCFMGGMALGPIVGGAMLEFFWWGSVFLLAVPVMLLLLVLGPVLLPEYKTPDAGKLDPLSVGLSLGGILPIVFGVKEIAKDGIGVVSVLSILFGLALAVVFVRRQRGLDQPLMDVRLFASRSFATALIIMLLGAAIGGGTILVVNLYLQSVAGLSPLQAGLWMVPSGLAMVAAAMSAPALARRFRPATVIAAGLFVAAAGYLLLAQVSTTHGLLITVVGVTIASAGSGPQAALSTNLVLGSTPPEKAGSAASLSETSGELGMALGAAFMGSIATAVYGAQLLGANLPGVPTAEVGAAGKGVVGAAEVAARLPAEQGGQLLASAREAFTSGLNAVAIVSAALLVAVGILALATLRHVPPTDAVEVEESTDHADAANHAG